MAATHFSGPVNSSNGFTAGDSGVQIKGIYSAAIAVTVAADLAAAEEDISLTITGVAPGDVVLLAPINSAMETGVAIVAVWISAANTVKVRVSNVNGSTLTGSTTNWNYLWFDLT